MPKKMWCRIAGFGESTAFGFTVDNEKVAVPLHYFKEIGGLEQGDIVSFDAVPFIPHRTWEHPLGHPAGQPKWFGRWPVLIGEKPYIAPKQKTEAATCEA